MLSGVASRKSCTDTVKKPKRSPLSGADCRWWAKEETFISPGRAFSEDYEGVLVRFHLSTDALNELKNIGVKDSAMLTQLTYPDMPMVGKGWKEKNAYFKSEGNQINIGLGRGKALDIFNEGVNKFERLN